MGGLLSACECLSSATCSICNSAQPSGKRVGLCGAAELRHTIGCMWGGVSAALPSMPDV